MKRSLSEVVQSYDVERSSDILVLNDDIKWENIGISAIQELKCGSFDHSQNQVAVWIKNAAPYEAVQCGNFQGFGFDIIGINPIIHING